MKISFPAQIILSGLFGGSLALAFAPFNIIWFALLSPIFLFFLVQKHTPRMAAILGFVFGIVFFGVGASWIFVSIYEFGGTAWPIAALITFLFVGLLASTVSLMVFILQYFFYPNTYQKLLLVYPALWSLVEFLRSWIFSGFPWLLLGQSVPNTFFFGLAPIFGVYATGMLLIIIGGLIALIALPAFQHQYYFAQQSRRRCLFILVLLLAGIYTANYVHWEKPLESSIPILLVQGNIPQSIRWDETAVPNILKTYEELTQVDHKKTLVIWPEGAIPLFPEQAKYFFSKIASQLQLTKSGLLTGIPWKENKNYYNAVVGLGEAQGHYFKRHLVPFGEYVPYEKYLRGLINFFNLPMSNFSAGDLKQSLIYFNHIPIGVYVCYEVAYSKIVRADLPQAKILVTVLDDAWFGHSLAPSQHLQIGQFMALAAARPMLFVGNNGLTAVISPRGRIQSIIKPFQTQTLSSEIYSYTGTTPWVRFGDMPWIIVMLLILFLNGKRKKC